MSTALFIAVGGSAVFLNSVEIYITSKRWNVLKTYDQLLLSLAISDLLTGSLALIYGICKDYISERYSADLYLLLIISTFNFTGLNLLAIGIDRYVSIRYPIKHRLWLTRRRMRILLTVQWILCLLNFGIIPLILVFSKQNKEIKTMYTSISTDGIITTGVYLFIFYALIIGLTAKRIRFKKQQSNSTENHPTKKEYEMILSCIRIVVFFIGTTYPFVISSKTTEKVSTGLAILLLTNNVVNPIIYFFKTYFKRRRQAQVQHSNTQ